jgi:hypothetical protein
LYLGLPPSQHGKVGVFQTPDTMAISVMITSIAFI